MPTISIDPETARERLREAGVDTEPGNTDHERWRAERGDAIAVAYDDKVVVQGASPSDLTLLIEEAGGRAHAYFDGGSRGNPGPAGIGWVLVSGDGILAEGGETIGRATNNQAEYDALIRVLEAARDLGLEELDIRGDSQLIVKQVRGEWDTNDPELKQKRVRARELLMGFSRWDIEHVPREINERADELANEALDDA